MFSRLDGSSRCVATPSASWIMSWHCRLRFWNINKAAASAGCLAPAGLLPSCLGPPLWVGTRDIHMLLFAKKINKKKWIFKVFMLCSSSHLIKFQCMLTVHLQGNICDLWGHKLKSEQSINGKGYLVWLQSLKEKLKLEWIMILKKRKEDKRCNFYKDKNWA